MVSKREKGRLFLDSLEEEWSGVSNLSLDSMHRLMLALGNPQDSFRSIHVAGTNGKGSVCAATAAILGSAGYKVGLTVSPHLSSLNERICIDGCAQCDEDLEVVAGSVAEACYEIGLRPSFFEAITAIAFCAFRQECVDFAVVEVGLGGRLDATNVISRPELAVITSIDLDHESILGDTVEKIAAEKAGIIKEGTAACLGRVSDSVRGVIEDRCKEMGATLFTFGADFSAAKQDYSCVYLSDRFGNFLFTSALPGFHQVDNMSVAITAARMCGASIESCAEGVREVFWPARLERVQSGKHEFVLDCAHNPAGIRELARYLEFSGLSPLTIAFGALATKNWRQMVEMLLPFAKEWVLLRPKSERAVDPREIAGFLSGFGVKSASFDARYNDCLEYLEQNAHGDAVLIVGSMYLVGEMRPLLVKERRPLWRRR